MKIENIEPFVRQALVGSLNINNTKDVNVKIKTVDCRLFFILSGGGKMTIEGVQYPIFPGTVIMFSAGTEYMWEVNEVKYYAVNFDYTHNNSNVTTPFHPIHSTVFSESEIIEYPYFDDSAFLNKPIVIQSAPSLEPMVRKIITEFFMKGKYSDILLTTFLKAVIISIVHTYGIKTSGVENGSAELSRRVIEYISLNYEKPLTNESVSRYFHYSVAYINRVLKKHADTTIHDFVISCRIIAAMEILRSQSISIGEVASKCGFQTLHHFTKTFKRRVNMTPMDYRRHNMF